MWSNDDKSERLLKAWFKPRRKRLKPLKVLLAVRIQRAPYMLAKNILGEFGASPNEKRGNLGSTTRDQ